MSLGESSRVRAGEEYVFTGFPLGIIFGLYPVTHRGMVSSITPIALQANAASQLDSTQIRHLRSRFDVFQLDATAYPGNSGSPLYDTETGKVVWYHQYGVCQGGQGECPRQAKWHQLCHTE